MTDRPLAIKKLVRRRARKIVADPTIVRCRATRWTAAARPNPVTTLVAGTIVRKTLVHATMGAGMKTPVRAAAETLTKMRVMRARGMTITGTTNIPANEKSEI